MKIIYYEYSILLIVGLTNGVVLFDRQPFWWGNQFLIVKMLCVVLKWEWKGIATNVSILGVSNAQVILFIFVSFYWIDYLFPSPILFNYLFLFKECHKFSFGDVIQMRSLYFTEKCLLRFVHMSNVKDAARKVSRVLWGIPRFFWLNRLKKNANMLQLLQSSIRALV